jgi:hemN_rel: putative oxygen-independent coproporphyrinogen III oxidase
MKNWKSLGGFIHLKSFWTLISWQEKQDFII